jgi:putative membrane protein
MDQAQQIKKYKPLIWVFSIVVPLLVAILLSPSFPKISLGDFNTYLFPKINATINSMVAIFLILGFFMIKTRKIKQHRFFMISAFVLSAIFLVSYVLYHISTPSTAHCDASPIGRVPYLIILISHIGLSVVIIPLSSFSIFHALSERFDKHRRLARITFPLWLYVAITGVLVYAFISPCYPG